MSFKVYLCNQLGTVAVAYKMFVVDREKTAFIAHVGNEGPDQIAHVGIEGPDQIAHARNPIRAFVAHLRNHCIIVHITTKGESSYQIALMGRLSWAIAVRAWNKAPFLHAAV